MCPDDPHQFIIDKLRYLQENGLDDLEWYAKIFAFHVFTIYSRLILI